MTAAALLRFLLLAPLTAGDLASDMERRIAAAESAGASVGVEVRSLGTGSVLVRHRAAAPLSAASNTKLATTAASLLLLPPDFAFETRLLAGGAVERERLRGELRVRGGGDPTFEVARVPAALLAKGIRRIEGDVVLDARLFDREFVHPSWPADQLGQPYAAGVCALPASGGCVEVTVSPGRAGEAAGIALAPAGAPYPVEGRVQTVAGKGKTIVHLAFAPSGSLRVRGEIASGSRPYVARVAVPDPLVFFAATLRRALEDSGISIGGAVREWNAEDGVEQGTLLDAVRSPLLQVLARINKRSDNFAAEHLLKVLGAREGVAGSFAAGVAAVRGALAAKGLSLEGVTMEDGSGLSRGNRFPPSFFAALLEAMWRGERRDDFFATLALPGEEGSTLERRLREEPLPRSVRAKTGYLSKVRALSGYARTRGEEDVAFSILVNGEGRGGGAEVRDLADDLVRLLVGSSRGGG